MTAKKCLYCDKVVNESNIRCSECDNIFQDGYIEGKEEMRCKFMNILETIKKLFKEAL